ncbi:hypothetical protein HYALB_00012944 [Hymenoscyphus albidus]|uniref:Uncharacterized protein n=1 Tax=Hymenoscyphus albidus TaxID=595503 RepID=A0A9N9LTD6_9HELO|nr:hypothetical protein HYALB_00012944 [Hymenoscyphus albidus]
MEYESDTHQTFIIAKVNQRYRGLAAIHTTEHFSVEDLIDIRLYLMKTFQNARNHPPLLAELTWASNQPTTFWDTKRDIKAKPEFPYIHTCLYIAVAASHPRSKVTSLPLNVVFDTLERELGIIVVDITDLSRPRCAFLRYGHMKMLDTVEFDISFNP